MAEPGLLYPLDALEPLPAPRPAPLATTTAPTGAPSEDVDAFGVPTRAVGAPHADEMQPLSEVYAGLMAQKMMRRDREWEPTLDEMAEHLGPTFQARAKVFRDGWLKQYYNIANSYEGAAQTAKALMEDGRGAKMDPRDLAEVVAAQPTDVHRRLVLSALVNDWRDKTKYKPETLAEWWDKTRLHKLTPGVGWASQYSEAKLAEAAGERILAGQGNMEDWIKYLQVRLPQTQAAIRGQGAPAAVAETLGGILQFMGDVALPTQIIGAFGKGAALLGKLGAAGAIGRAGAGLLTMAPAGVEHGLLKATELQTPQLAEGPEGVEVVPGMTPGKAYALGAASGAISVVPFALAPAAKAGLRKAFLSLATKNPAFGKAVTAAGSALAKTKLSGAPEALEKLGFMGILENWLITQGQQGANVAIGLQNYGLPPEADTVGNQLNEFLADVTQARGEEGHPDFGFVHAAGDWAIRMARKHGPLLVALGIIKGASEAPKAVGHLANAYWQGQTTRFERAVNQLADQPSREGIKNFRANYGRLADSLLPTDQYRLHQTAGRIAYARDLKGALAEAVRVRGLTPQEAEAERVAAAPADAAAEAPPASPLAEAKELPKPETPAPVVEPVKTPEPAAAAPEAKVEAPVAPEAKVETPAPVPVEPPAPQGKELRPTLDSDILRLLQDGRARDLAGVLAGLDRKYDETNIDAANKALLRLQNDGKVQKDPDSQQYRVAGTETPPAEKAVEAPSPGPKAEVPEKPATGEVMLSARQPDVPRTVKYKGNRWTTGSLVATALFQGKTVPLENVPLDILKDAQSALGSTSLKLSDADPRMERIEAAMDAIDREVKRRGQEKSVTPFTQPTETPPAGKELAPDTVKPAAPGQVPPEPLPAEAKAVQPTEAARPETAPPPARQEVQYRIVRNPNQEREPFEIQSRELSHRGTWGAFTTVPGAHFATREAAENSLEQYKEMDAKGLKVAPSEPPTKTVGAKSPPKPKKTLPEDDATVLKTLPGRIDEAKRKVAEMQRRLDKGIGKGGVELTDEDRRGMEHDVFELNQRIKTSESKLAAAKARLAEKEKPKAEAPQPAPAAKPKTPAGRPLKVGDNERIMGVESTLAETKTVDGVRYELFNGGKLSEKRAAVRVTDVDSGSTVTLRQYPTYDAAEEAYRAAVKVATPEAKAPQPAPAAKPEEEAARPQPAGPGRKTLELMTPEEAAPEPRPLGRPRPLWSVKYMRRGSEPPYPFGKTNEVVPADTRDEAIAAVLARSSPRFKVTARKTGEYERPSVTVSQKEDHAAAVREHRIAIERALEARRPVSAAAAEEYGVKVPDGYKPEGRALIYVEESSSAKSERAKPAPEAKPEEVKGEVEVDKPFARIGEYEFGLRKGMDKRPDMYYVGLRRVGSTGEFESGGYGGNRDRMRAIDRWVEAETKRESALTGETHPAVKAAWDKAQTEKATLAAEKAKNEAAAKAEEDRKRAVADKYEAEVKAVELPKAENVTLDFEHDGTKFTISGRRYGDWLVSKHPEQNRPYLVTHVHSGMGAGPRFARLADALNLVRAFMHAHFLEDQKVAKPKMSDDQHRRGAQTIEYWRGDAAKDLRAFDVPDYFTSTTPLVAKEPSKTKQPPPGKPAPAAKPEETKSKPSQTENLLVQEENVQGVPSHDLRAPPKERKGQPELYATWEVGDTAGMLFNYTTRHGTSNKNAPGQYKPVPHIVRLATGANPPTSAEVAMVAGMHELAHHLANPNIKGSINLDGLPAHVQAVLRALDYDQRQRRVGEGFAEFLRAWMTKTGTAEDVNKAPKLAPVVEWWNEYLKQRPDVAKKLYRLRDMIDNIRMQSYGEQAMRQVKPGTETTKPVRTWGEAVRDFFVNGGRGAEHYLISDREAMLERAEAASRKANPDAPEPFLPLKERFSLHHMSAVHQARYAMAVGGIRKLSDGTPILFSDGTPMTIKNLMGDIKPPEGALMAAWRKARGLVFRSVEDQYDAAPDYQRAYIYSVAEHGKEAWEHKGPKGTAKPINPGLTMPQINYILSHTKPEDAARYQKFHKRLTEFYNGQLEMAVDAGVLSREMADAWIKEWPGFLSLRRQVSGGKLFGGPRRGSNLPVIDPMETAVRRMASVYNRATLQRTVDALFSTIFGDVVPDPDNPGQVKWQPRYGMGAWAEHIRDITGTEEAKATPKDLQQTLFDMGYNADAEAVAEFTRNRKWATGTAPFQIIRQVGEGKNRRYVVTANTPMGRKVFEVHPDVIEALAILPRESNIAVRALNTYMKIRKTGLTGLSLQFLVRNPLRDLHAFSFNANYAGGGWGNPVDIAYRWADAVGRLAYHFGSRAAGGEGSDWVALYESLGGRSGSFFGEGGDRLTPHDARTLIREAMAGHNPLKRGIVFFANPLDTIARIGQFTEAPPRLAEFIAACEKLGVDPTKWRKGEPIDMDAVAKAMYAAHEVTVDFRRMGAFTRQINPMFLFLSANIAGLDKYRRTWRDHPVRSAALTAAQAMAAAAFYYYAKDKEWFKDAAAWFKNGYIGFGDKQVDAIIPLGREEMNGWRIGLATADYLETSDSDAAKDAVAYMATNALAASGFVGQEWIEADRNRKFFPSGTPIVPKRQEGLRTELQYTPQTREFYKTLGGVVNASPAKTEHVVEGTFGPTVTAVGDLAQRGLDKWQGKPSQEVEWPGQYAFRPRQQPLKSVQDFRQAAESATTNAKSARETGKAYEGHPPEWWAAEDRRLGRYEKVRTAIYQGLQGAPGKELADKDIHRWVRGVERVALGQEVREEVAPNPFMDPHAPTRVRDAADDALAAAALQAARARPQPRVVRPTDAHDYRDRVVAWERERNEALTFLKETGASQERIEAALKARQREHGQPITAQLLGQLRAATGKLFGKKSKKVLDR